MRERNGRIAGMTGADEVLIAIIREVAASDGDTSVAATKLCTKSKMGQQAVVIPLAHSRREPVTSLKHIASKRATRSSILSTCSS